MIPILENAKNAQNSMYSNSYCSDFHVSALEEYILRMTLR